MCGHGYEQVMEGSVSVVMQAQLSTEQRVELEVQCREMRDKMIEVLTGHKLHATPGSFDDDGMEVHTITLDTMSMALLMDWADIGWCLLESANKEGE